MCTHMITISTCATRSRAPTLPCLSHAFSYSGCCAYLLDAGDNASQGPGIESRPSGGLAQVSDDGCDMARAVSTASTRPVSASSTTAVRALGDGDREESVQATLFAGKDDGVASLRF